MIHFLLIERAGAVVYLLGPAVLELLPDLLAYVDALFIRHG